MDRKTLDLPANQRELFSAIIKHNPRAVMFIVSGYPYAIKDGRAASILHICHAGPAMGSAVTKTLFGDISPAGRCPVTWYSSERELCDIKDYNIMRTKSTYLYYDGEPLYPFGYGLSYTAFRYGALNVEKRGYEQGEKITLSFDLENVGMCDGDEVVQVYVSYPRLPLKMPAKQLKAFKRVHVARGDMVRVNITIDTKELACWDPNSRDFSVFSGDYELMVGSSSADIRKTKEIHINGATYEGRILSNNINAVDCEDYIGVEYLADDALEEYALINDWQSILRFEGCIMKSYHAVEIIASNPGAPAKLTFIFEDTGAVIAECEISPTGSLTEFKKFSASSNSVVGNGRIKITSSGMISLKSFRFI